MLVEKLEVVRMIESVLNSKVFQCGANNSAIRAVENLLYNVQQLLGVPSSEVVDITRSIKGGMVLSPREVEVVECFARGWVDGDDRSLYGSLCYQDAFDLMGRLKVDCSGVRDLVQEYQDRVDEFNFLDRFGPFEG